MPYKVAGIDVHKKVLMVVNLDTDEPDSEPERRRFGSTTSELRRLSAWLREQGVRQAVMESTPNTGGRSGTSWNRTWN